MLNTRKRLSSFAILLQFWKEKCLTLTHAKMLPTNTNMFGMTYQILELIEHCRVVLQLSLNGLFTPLKAMAFNANEVQVSGFTKDYQNAIDKLRINC